MTRTIVFAKAPVPGRVKTRLIPALGAEGAARLAAQMLRSTLSEALGAGLGPVELCMDPPPGHRAWSDQPLSGLDLTAQGPGDLGRRLGRAAARRLAQGERILLIGTDCPSLDRRRLCAAAASLDSHEAAIHPAEDGGYVLLGLGRDDPSLFDGIPWSGPTVAADTIARIRKLGWRLDVRETLRDIDEPRDLQ